MKALVLTALAVLLTTTAAEPRDFSGQARALDGDDILLCDGNTCTDMRLCGIDAPERGCPCYDEATKALQALVQGKQVKCIQVGGGTPCDGKSPPTNRNRAIAQCFVDGTDIGGVLVERGLACDWERFSEDTIPATAKATRVRKIIAPVVRLHPRQFATSLPARLRAATAASITCPAAAATP